MAAITETANILKEDMCIILKEDTVTENFHFKSSNRNFIKPYVHKDSALLPRAHNFNSYL